MTIINKRLINYILIDKRLNEHFGQISIDFWSLEITEIKFEIRNQLEIKLISKSRTRFQQVSDPSAKAKTKTHDCCSHIHNYLAFYFNAVQIHANIHVGLCA